MAKLESGLGKVRASAHAHQEAATETMKEAGGGWGTRRRKPQRKGGEGGERKKYALVSYAARPSDPLGNHSSFSHQQCIQFFYSSSREVDTV